MEYVSIPRGAMAARWRPISHTPVPQQQPWRPAPALAYAPPPTRLGQISPLSVVDVTIDTMGSAGAALVGFAIALWGSKDSPAWRWIGGLVGAVGTMRVLHNVSKSGA